MLEKLDGLLDKLTMYKLLLYFLIALIAIAMGLSAIGKIAFSPIDIAGSALYLTVACWIANQFFSRTLKIPVSSDSTYITALILALIIPPNFSKDGILFLTAAAGLAIASKYLLTINRKHIFNPAAIAVVLTALGPHQTATWWVGTPSMTPFVIIGGFLVMRRIRRTEMVGSFLGIALGSVVLMTVISHGDVLSTLNHVLLSSALFFMAFVMLTEPLTSPSTKQHEIWYSILTGLLFSPRVHFGSVYSTPELDIIVGNIFAFIVNPKVKLFPQLKSRIKITPDTADFVFYKDHDFNYKPGQYMEWTLPHTHSDLRGSRRYFTLASSPTEENIRIGVKFYKEGSSFKKALLAMNEHSAIVAANLGGDFTLPSDTSRKVVLIAGGIGVTPFRSMIKFLLDTNSKRPVTLLYAVNTPSDLAYKEVFEAARQQLDIHVLYFVKDASSGLPDSNYRTGLITPELLKSEVPDFHESLFYVSGPHAMVVGIEKSLKSSGIHKNQIKTDFFSGYA